VGQKGVPVHAKASNGATADVTFDGASWVPDNCVGARPCAVVELTIIGTSVQPFKFDESYVTGNYGGGPQPWTHPNESGRIGGDPIVDYVAINKLPLLRLGSVTKGQTKHGFVGIPLGSKTDCYIELADPDDVSNVEAGWLADA
jgi:hypothetical protein